MSLQKLNFIYNNRDVFHIFIYVPAGSIYEPDELRGISHLLEHMVLKHTKEFNEKELLEEITILGGSYNAVTDRDATFYYIMTHKDNYKKSIDILHSVICEPIFKKYELDIERKVVLEEINKRIDSDLNLYNLSYLTILEPTNKYTFPVEGSTKTLNNITVDDLTKYFRDHYKNFSVFINCDEKNKTEIENYTYHKFGKNQIYNFNDISMMYSNLNFRTMLYVIPKKYTQYSTHIVFPGFIRSMVKENIILNFIKYCLVSAGLYSMLTYQLRSKRGLIYSIYSINEIYRYIGLFKFSILTSDKKTDHILSIIFDILYKLKRNGMTKKLMNYFKKGFLNEQKYALTNEEFKSILHSESTFYASNLSDEDYIKLIKNITTDDIKNIATKIFDFSKMGVLTYGNYTNDKIIKNKLINLINTYNTISQQK